MSDRDVGVDLPAIRARCEAATEGPWYCVVNDLVGGKAVCNVDKPCSRQDHRPPLSEFSIADLTMYDADAEFIAHARSDVPALCDALDAARRALREALPIQPWGENDECYSCGGGEPEHWDGCNWVVARALVGDVPVPREATALKTFDRPMPELVDVPPAVPPSVCPTCGSDDPEILLMACAQRAGDGVLDGPGEWHREAFHRGGSGVQAVEDVSTSSWRSRRTR